MLLSSKAGCTVGNLSAAGSEDHLCIQFSLCWTFFLASSTYTVKLHQRSGWNTEKVRGWGWWGGRTSKEANKVMFRETFCLLAVIEEAPSKVCIRTFVNKKFCLESSGKICHVTTVTEQEWLNSCSLVAKMPLEVWISGSSTYGSHRNVLQGQVCWWWCFYIILHPKIFACLIKINKWHFCQHVTFLLFQSILPFPLTLWEVPQIIIKDIQVLLTVKYRLEVSAVSVNAPILLKGNQRQASLKNERDTSNPGSIQLLTSFPWNEQVTPSITTLL